MKEMSNNGIAFNCKRKQITIKVREYVEFKEVIKTLKKQMREIRVLYKNSEPAIISIVGRDFKRNEKKLYYFDASNGSYSF